jgi:hypothetical protein
MEGTSRKYRQSRRVLPVLFDIKPVTATGDLDIEKIRQIKAVLDLRKDKTEQENQPREKALKIEIVSEGLRDSDKDFEYKDLALTKLGLDSKEVSEVMPVEIPTREQILAELDEVENLDNLLAAGQVNLASDQLVSSQRERVLEPISVLEEFYFPEVASQENVASSVAGSGLRSRHQRPLRRSPEKVRPKSLVGFFVAGLLIALIIPGVAWLSQGLAIKEDVVSSSLLAYQSLLTARQSLEQADWQTAEQSFSLARSDFLEAHQEINKLGRLTLGILEQLPGGSLVSSGSHLVKVGENLARAGQNLTSAIKLFSFNNLFNSINLADSSQNNILATKENTLTDLMVSSQDNLTQALAGIRLANQELSQVKVEALPADIQPEVVSLKEKLPLVEEVLVQAVDYSAALLKILGHDNPRQYLLIFQNNSEIRATGGFIGTYGLLTLDKGVIDDLFIEGVFNADGQLHEKIIPPRPIQKISTAWSMHDANWFADFPTSAQKIAWFYEKTGGPTVDGVISLTPTVIERLLRLTGPISMPEYEVVLTSENFVELIQYKVEVDYDKELNRPKKILADFAPKFIEALNQLSAQKRKEALEIIFDCLKEKHILIYFNDPSLEELVIEEGWAGQILPTDKDYLSVVSSNINGYKTDRVVKETIQHQAEIQEDGSIIDTLTITRQHQGGQLAYDWWNRVNANYLRVYLPLGSQLISAQGQTWEIYQPPIDYQKHGFKADPLVSSIESKMVIDSKTGTHIFEENGKTVFANWVYVSPGETVTLTYRYKLPFKINLTKPSDSYSLLVQKQSGSLGSQFSHQLNFPADWQISWQYPDQGKMEGGSWQLETDLRLDRFLGVAFEF